jgi:hypothetical protein
MLEFDCTNIVAKYEFLLLGLELARGMKVKVLKVVDDFDLIIQLVRNQYATKNDIMKKYKNVVWDSIELFAS